MSRRPGACRNTSTIGGRPSAPGPSKISWTCQGLRHGSRRPGTYRISCRSTCSTLLWRPLAQAGRAISIIRLPDARAAVTLAVAGYQVGQPSDSPGDAHVPAPPPLDHTLAADPPPPAAEGRIPDPTGDSEALESCPDTDNVRSRARGRGRGARGRGRGRHRAQPMDDVAASTPGAQRQPRPPGHAAAWAALDQVDLGQELRVRCVTLRDVPRFCRGRFRQALTTALAELDRASAVPGDEEGQRRAWTLFALCSRMLLHRPGHKGKAGSRLKARNIRISSEDFFAGVRAPR